MRSENAAVWGDRCSRDPSDAGSSMERSDRRHLAGMEPDSSNGHLMRGRRSEHKVSMRYVKADMMFPSLKIALIVGSHPI